MKDDLGIWLRELATSPIAYGFAAAIARWYMGDRAGGWRNFVSYLTASLFVAWALSLWMIDEGMLPARSGFWLLLFSFVAKDVLIVLISIGAQFRTDPFGLIKRVKDALAGGIK